MIMKTAESAELLVPLLPKVPIPFPVPRDNSNVVGAWVDCAELLPLLKDGDMPKDLIKVLQQKIDRSISSA